MTWLTVCKLCILAKTPDMAFARRVADQFSNEGVLAASSRPEQHSPSSAKKNSICPTEEGHLKQANWDLVVFLSLPFPIHERMTPPS